MPAPAKCPRCGAIRDSPAWARSGCPRCELGAGLESTPDVGEMQADPDPRDSDAGSLHGKETSTRPLSWSARTPEMIGPYRIVREIGHGGMGIVFEAEQQSPRRAVAIKVVRGDRYVDDEMIRMFRREAQTLARLKHPSIAAIYESGRTDDGQHYFAMELVRGDTLSDYLGRRPDRMSPEEASSRLALFRRICSAVSYAHQRGVIHRDLKPLNILVVRDPAAKAISGSSLDSPEIKILDFGLARITESDLAASTLITEMGKIKGTLPYMSPEQVRGNSDEIDLRTDVYSLGVILYEMLAHRHPIDLEGLSLPDAIQVIQNRDPIPLGRSWSGTRSLDRDLETIVLKALEKEPHRRYQSVSSLREDVERYLADQPILARPPSAAYQLRKLVARHKLPFGFAATVAVLLLAFAITMAIQARRITRERDRALAAESVARAEAVTALEVTDFLVDLFEVGADERLPGQAVTLTEFLERGMAKIRLELEDQPEVRARMLDTLGRVHGEVRKFDLARELIEEGLGLRREHLGPEHLDVGESLHNLGRLHLQQGRAEEAAASFEEALRIREANLGPDHLDVARTAANLASTYQRLKRFEEAEALFARSIAIKEAIPGLDPVDLAKTLNSLGTLYRGTDRFDEAERLYKRVISIREDALGPDDDSLAGALNNLAILYHRQNRLMEAKPLYERALPIMEHAYGKDHPRVLGFRGNMAILHNGLGEYAAAEALFKECLASQERHSGVGAPETARWMVSLVAVLEAQERYGEAATMLERWLAVREAELGANSADYGGVLGSAAATMRELGREEEAGELERRARLILEGLGE